jgi:hypothetical protein
MRTIHLISGLKTLQPYYIDQAGYHNGADHDVFYAYSTDRPLSEEDVKHMVDLGWFQEVKHDDEFMYTDYDPSEGWLAYV